MDVPRPPRRRISVRFALIFFAPFVLLLACIFAIDWYENRSRVWTPVERQPVFAYIPANAHLVGSSHTGWTMSARCPAESRCEYTHTFASTLEVAELRAQVARELESLGFARRAPNPPKCAPYYAHAERFAKGDISVWPTYGPTPFANGKSSTIPTSEGRSVVRLRIDNMEIAWGC